MNKTLNIMRLISSIIISTLFIYIFINLKDKNLIMLPFVLFALCSLAGEVSLLINNAKLAHYFKMAQDFSFLLLWYGMLIFMIYIAVTQKQIILIIISIPFWFVGLLPLKKYFNRK